MVRFSALGFCFVVAGWTTGCSDSCEDCSQEETSRLEPDTQAPGAPDASAIPPPPNVPAAGDDEPPASNEPAMPSEIPVGGTGGASGAGSEAAPVASEVGGSSAGTGLGGTTSDGGASERAGSAGSGLTQEPEPIPTPLDAGTSEPTETGGGGAVGAGGAGTGTFTCDPETAEDDCEWCVQLRCCDERIACADNADCAEDWPAFNACMDAADLATNPSADPISAVMDCLSEASPTGNALDISDEMLDLVACIGTPVEESMDDLLEGDGQCTFACYGVDTLEPVDFDDGFDDAP